MATNAKYLINTTTGSYIDWSYAKIPGFSVQGKAAAIVGGVGNDAVYVGAGSSVDFTDTGVGNDSLYLTGNFSDYTQSVNAANGTYTFTRTGLGAGMSEEIIFKASSNSDAVYFANGHINLNFTATQPGGTRLYDAGTRTFRQLSASDVVAGGTTAYPLNTLPTPGTQAINLTITDADGLDVPLLPVAGESMIVHGGIGTDRVYVKAGTAVDFTDTGAGNDHLFLTGSFSEYSQQVDTKTGVYTFSRGTSEVVKFKSTSGSDTVYFADGHLNIQLLAAQASGTALYNRSTREFRSILQSDLASGGTPAETNSPVDGLPIITGQAIAGQVLTADTSGLLDPNGIGALSYVWKADGVAIPGATGNSFTMTDTQVGKLVTVTVSYTDGLGSAESASSTDLAAALNAIRSAAEADSASVTTPSLRIYTSAGVTGMSDGTNGDLGAINSALNSAAINGAKADSTAEIQAIVDAYNTILAEANGSTPDATPGANPDAAQYAAIGADIGVAATDTENRSLLNDALGGKVLADVDTITEINALAAAANAVQNQAAGTSGLTMAQLGLLGITDQNGALLSSSISASVQAAILAKIANAADSGTDTDTVAKLQALVRSVLPTPSVNLGEIANGDGGFVINGASLNRYSGYSVSNAGDVNGDGLGDMIVSDYGVNNRAGASYVVFGKSDTSAVDLAAVASGTGGFVINGVVADDQSGKSVSSAGDVNGDGLADLLVGANGANGSAGKSYVVFGKAGTTAVNLADVGAGIGGFVMNGEAASDLSGWSVSSLGDLNGDGLADLLVGAFNANGTTGRGYVVYGKANTTAVSLSNVAAGIGGFAMSGASTDSYSGGSISSAGDVNGDGLADLIVGGYDILTSVPRKTYVVFGSTNHASINLSSVAAGNGGFVINGLATDPEDQSGRSVSSAGDVNGDGLADLIVGAYRPGTNLGKSYVVFGKASGTAVNLADVRNGIGGFAINGEGYYDTAGTSVSSAGDVNGDGLADLLVGASGANNYAGKTYVVYGKTDSAAINLGAVAAGYGGFAINGSGLYEQSGASVSSAGDVNGDGLADLLVGAYSALNQGGYAYVGKSYVIFGGSQFATTLDYLGGTSNDFLTGTGAAETFAAGAGHDRIVGNGGADVMMGGAGNDTFVLNASNVSALQSVMGSGGNTAQLARVDGGTGFDTLQFSDANLDLTAIANAGAGSPDGLSRINSIERIDLLTDSNANTLTLALADVLDLAGMNLINAGNKASLGWTGGTYNFGATESRHQLLVDGDSADQLISSGGFVDTQQTAIINGHTYEVYNQGSYAQLLIESAMNMAGVH